MSKPKGTLLVLSQVFIPDPASVGQHMADAAEEMVRRGYRVIVYTANRGYDDPSIKFPRREVIRGIEVRRLAFSSFGKKSILWRLVGALFFMIQCLAFCGFTPRLAGILVSTSPPMCAIAAAIIAKFRGVPLKYWVMDLNPDQMIALGRIKSDSTTARIYDAINRFSLDCASDVVALDRFMVDRLCRKRNIKDKVVVLPPWPHEDQLNLINHADNPFRRQYNPDGKFVIMYSGNHSFTSPLTTILEAALQLQDCQDLLFLFIGGGVGKKEVDDIIAEHQPTNIVSLPYQPLDQIKYSLSAADVHVVSVGENVAGIVHPCKVYGAMALGRPILLLGPDPCHVSDIVDEHQIGWRIAHGAVDDACKLIQNFTTSDQKKLEEMGKRAQDLIRMRFSKSTLMNAFCDVLERGLAPSADQSP